MSTRQMRVKFLTRPGRPFRWELEPGQAEIPGRCRL